MLLTLAGPWADKIQLLLCTDLLSCEERILSCSHKQRGQTNQEQALNYSEVSICCLLESGINLQIPSLFSKRTNLDPNVLISVRL